MRFMFIVRSNQASMPTAELMQAMHVMAEREIAAGRMIDDGGLMPLATGAQIAISGGKLNLTDGPFIEAKEVVGGYAVFELPGKEEAIVAAKEFMQLHVDHMPGWEGTMEIRAVAGSQTAAISAAAGHG
jgi:hypothetical protein